MGYVEFIGDRRYQVSSSVIIYYQKQSIAVGINLTDEQKEKLKDIISYDEDLFGIIRFQINSKDISQIYPKLNCHYQLFNNNTLIHFPKIKDVVTTFEEYNPLCDSALFYNNYNWEKTQKQIGIFKTTSDSHFFYLKIKEKIFKIPSNIDNPEGWLLAECYQLCCERNNIFVYNKNDKTIIVKNFNLPILVERILRLNSLYQRDAIQEHNFQIVFPNISISTIKELNRIFDTKTEVING